MKIIKKIKGIFVKEEEEQADMPWERCIIVYSKISITNGSESESTKSIVHYRGETIFKTYPFSRVLQEKLEQVQRIPFYDFTRKPIKFPDGEEINPNEINWIE